MLESLYSKRELTQWGYVALVGITLAFTTITTATAGIGTQDPKLISENQNLGACLLQGNGNESSGELVCTSNPQLKSIESSQNLLGSTFASLSPFRDIRSLSRSKSEKSAD